MAKEWRDRDFLEKEEEKVCRTSYLSNHHMAIKSSFPMLRTRPRNMTANLRHNRRAKSNVGHEMAIHDINT